MSQTSNLSQPLSQETFDSLWQQMEEINKEKKEGTYTNIYSEEYGENNMPLTSNSEMDRHVELKLDYFQLENQATNIASTSEANHSYSQAKTLSPSVPTLIDYNGFYGFVVEPIVGNSNAKSTAYTYAKNLNKLFVKEGICIPFKFSTIKCPPFGAFIRAMAMYKKPEHIMEVVQRCENHKKNDIFSEEAAHFIRSENRAASYHINSCGRYSVLLPFEYPQAGTSYIEQLFKFTCLSSCPPVSINRRPLYIVFTLEDSNGIILGRQKTELKVCSCPGRDRKMEETNCKKRKNSVLSKQLTFTSYGEQQTNDDDEEEFHVTIKGRENYEVIMRVKEALELKKFVPVAAREKYMKEQSKTDFRTEQHDEPDSQSATNTEHSLSGWLTKVACSACIDAFSNIGITHINELDNISYQEIEKLDLTQRMKNKVWKAILSYKSDHSLSESTTKTNDFTNFSSSDSQKSGLSYSATKLTFREQMTFKRAKFNN